MDMFRSALAMVIHKNGNVIPSDIDGLIERYRELKGISLDRKKYERAVQTATRHYKKNKNRLFVCTDSRCLDKAWLLPNDRTAKQLSQYLGCPVENTGCHWVCEEAPVVTLKAGEESIRFSNCSSRQSWEHLLEEARKVLTD